MTQYILIEALNNSLNNFVECRDKFCHQVTATRFEQPLNS